jgi:FkbM family methyltransferase
LGWATRNRGIVVDLNGDSLRLTPSYATYHATRGFEPEVHASLTRTIGSGMSVLDVGAHVGLFTLAAALRVGPTGRVVAFEPSPATLASLHRHIALNGFGDRVEVVPAVVGEVEGETAFFVSGETMSASVSRVSLDELSPGHRATRGTEIRVPAVTLDSFCAQRGIRPDRVKIDVEGAELRVLRGAVELLRGSADVVCEIHPAQLEAAGDSEEELIAFVNGHGRTLATIDERSDGIYHAQLLRR